MNTLSDLTIVIPAKNEAKLISFLLTSLTRQDYPQMRSTKVYLADANSTDGTPAIAKSPAITTRARTACTVAAAC